MEILMRRGGRGDLICVVRFKKNSENFDPSKLEWAPKLSELRDIVESVEKCMGKSYEKWFREAN